jgi:hypothetical protein
MAGLPVETCRWKYHNKNTPVELSAFVWFLIHIIQINARNLVRIKIHGIWSFDLCSSLRHINCSKIRNHVLRKCHFTPYPLPTKRNDVCALVCDDMLINSNQYKYTTKFSVWRNCTCILLSYMFRSLFGSSSCHHIKLFLKCKSKSLYKIYISSVRSWNYKSSIIVVFLNYIIIVATVYCVFAKSSVTEIRLLKSKYMKPKFPAI